MATGRKSPEVKKALQDALNRVLDDPSLNDRDKLLKAIEPPKKPKCAYSLHGLDIDSNATSSKGLDFKF